MKWSSHSLRRINLLLLASLLTMLALTATFVIDLDHRTEALHTRIESASFQWQRGTTLPPETTSTSADKTASLQRRLLVQAVLVHSVTCPLLLPLDVLALIQG